MKPRTARLIAWSLVAVFIVLAATGLTLQALAGTSYSNIGLPVLTAAVALAGMWPVTGALIVSRHPRHPVGWLLSLSLMVASFDMFAYGTFSYDAVVYPGSFPGVDLALIWLNMSGFPFSILAFTLILLLFPDGRFSTPRWRVVGRVAAGALLLHLTTLLLKPGPVDPTSGILAPNPLGVGAPLWSALEPVMWTAFAIMALCYGASIVSLVLRLRRARGEERQQIKWLVYPSTIFLISVPFLFLGINGGDELILGMALALSLPAIMGTVIAVAFAILRYRLYDIDLIINRTLVYGALTASVVMIYVLVVGGLGAIFQAESNLLVSLLATGLAAVLFQPLRERLQRAVNRLTYGERDEPFEALARLGRRLEEVFSPQMVYPAILETVAQALKLPYAAIAVRRGEAFEIAEEFGDPTGESAAYPLFHQGQVVGKLVAGRRGPGEDFSPADERLLRGFARQAGTAIHAIELAADLQRSRQQLVSAREEERRRLRRDLHDGLGPALASVVWQAEGARDLVHTDPAEAVQLLESSIEQAQSALADIRRLVYGLRPPALDELGLVGALEQAAREHQGASVTIEAPAPLPPLPAAVEVAAYRIAREALKNAVEHGRAKNCAVRLALDGRFCLTVRDDGLGLPGRVSPGVGLVSMRERAEELGGEFTIHPRKAGGTEVEVRLPLE